MCRACRLAGLEPVTPHHFAVKLLTLARDLQRRKARERTGKFVAEGVRTVESLMDSSFEVTGILAADSLAADTRGQAILARAEQSKIPILHVSDAEFASSASTDTPQGILAISDIPDKPMPVPGPNARYLVLDGLQDPGNAGTVIRSAMAFGVTATACLPGTVDLWNAKVVRSAMGSLFFHSVVSLSADELRMFLVDHKVECWAADTQGDKLGDVLQVQPSRLALVVSNEGAGLSPEAARLASRRVSIAMAPGVESLNVAVATGILLHALRREAADAQ